MCVLYGLPQAVLLLALGTPRAAQTATTQLAASAVAHSSDRGAPPGVRLLVAERLVRGVGLGLGRVRRVGVRVGIGFGVRVGFGNRVRVWG